MFIQLINPKSLYLYNYHFETRTRPILVDNKGHEYKFASITEMEKLSYMGEPFSIIYMDQVSRITPNQEEISFMDRVTSIPTHVEDSKATEGHLVLEL